MMIELYGGPTSNGLRAMIMLEECALPYRLHRIDLGKGEQRADAYLQLNPMAQIPTIVDPDGPGGQPITLTQSMAILRYLAEKTGRWIPTDHASETRFNEVLMIIASDLSITFGAILLASKSADYGGETGAALRRRFAGYMTVWDGWLGTRDYCFDNAPTIADFAMFPMLLRDRQLKLGLVGEEHANVNAYFERIAQRPTIVKVLGFA